MQASLVASSTTTPVLVLLEAECRSARVTTDYESLRVKLLLLLPQLMHFNCLELLQLVLCEKRIVSANAVLILEGCTALQLCTMRNFSADVAAILLDAGANVWTHTERAPLSALFLAARLNRASLLTLFGARHADVANTIEFSTGRLPLHYAVLNSSVEACNALVRLGSELDRMDVFGMRPAHCLFQCDIFGDRIAHSNAQLEIIELLYCSGGPDAFKGTILHDPVFDLIEQEQWTEARSVIDRVDAANDGFLTQ